MERLKVIGAIVNAAIAAMSFAFNAFSINPDIPWSWIALITLLIFVTLMFWILVGRESQIKRLQKQLNDTFLSDNQKEHSEKIRLLIESWMVSLSVPKISGVEPGTTSPMDEVKHNLRFDYLKAHLPSVKLWQDHVNWDTKMQEYLDKCKQLKTEIQTAWKIDGTSTSSYFATPILEAIEGKELCFWVVAGQGYGLGEVSHQILIVNNKEVVFGDETRNDNTRQDLRGDKCNELILCIEYRKLADQFSNTTLAVRVKQLSSDLLDLSSDICQLLYQYRESAEYNKHFCKDCPLKDNPLTQPSTSHKGGFKT